MPLPPESLTTLAAFAGVWAVRWAAHDVGDLWTQTHHQALTKGAPGRTGVWACVKHVLTYEATAVAFFLFACMFIDFGVDLLAFAAGTFVSGVTHFVADRRDPLRRIADACNSGEVYRLTDGLHGAFQIDRSWHKAWIFAAALITAGGVERLGLSLAVCLLAAATIALRVHYWEARYNDRNSASEKDGEIAVDNAGGMTPPRLPRTAQA